MFSYSIYCHVCAVFYTERNDPHPVRFCRDSDFQQNVLNCKNSNYLYHVKESISFPGIVWLCKILGNGTVVLRYCRQVLTVNHEIDFED